MKLCSKILAIAILAFTTYAMVGCAAPAGYSYQNISISLAHYCADCGDGDWTSPTTTSLVAGAAETVLVTNQTQGGCVLFTATVTNAPPTVTWALSPTGNLTETGTNAGIPTSTSGEPSEATPIVGTLLDSTGLSTYYCQNGIPIYTGQALTQALSLGLPQGDVLMTASVPADPSNSSTVFTKNEVIQLYNVPSSGYPQATPHLVPQTSSTSTNTVANVAHGSSFSISGYAVGATPCGVVATTSCASGVATYTADNSVTWELAFYPRDATTGASITGITKACTFPTPAAATPAAITSLLNSNSECASEGYIVVTGTDAMGTSTATYYAPATVPANVGGTSGVPIITLYSNAVPQNTTPAYAYVNVY